MSSLTATKLITAPVELVFRTISDVREFANISSDVVKVEFVSEARSGAGTIFRETRKVDGAENTVELEITEYVLNERVRFVADSHGTIWDSVYTVTSDGRATTVTLTMDARPYKLAAKLMNPLVKGMVLKALEKDMDAVKSHCESGSASSGE